MTDQQKDVKYRHVADSRLNREAQATSHKAHELSCASCGHSNADSAMFCAECGKSLLAPSTCPECKTATKPGADICEACGTWLLPGQCMFCSAAVGENQAYCGTCGNPVAGIPCPGCGKKSIFDFCRTCAIPLSSQAQQLVLAASNDPAQQEIATLLKELHELQFAAKTADGAGKEPATHKVFVDDQLAKMKLARAMLSAPSAPQYVKSQSKPLFSDQQKQHINQLGDQIIREEERRRKVHEQINQALNRLGGKTFSSSQDARRFFMSLVSALPDEAMQALNASGRLRWRCHAYSNEHDSPSGCADPSQGGVWVIS